MKTQLVVATLAMFVGLSGMTALAVADSSSGSASSSSSRSYGSKGEFTGSWREQIPITPWNQGRTSSQSEDSRSGSARSTTGESCSLQPRFGFSDAGNLSAC